MKTRYKGYKDYGFTDGEEKRLMQWVRSVGFKHNHALWTSCRTANPAITDDLYYSLVRNVSYDDLERASIDQTYAKNDFYAYRRKAMGIFREKMKRRGCYPSDVSGAKYY